MHQTFAAQDDREQMLENFASMGFRTVAEAWVSLAARQEDEQKAIEPADPAPADQGRRKRAHSRNPAPMAPLKPGFPGMEQSLCRRTGQDREGAPRVA